jgi:hypothetical protein
LLVVAAEVMDTAVVQVQVACWLAFVVLLLELRFG